MHMPAHTNTNAHTHTHKTHTVFLLSVSELSASKEQGKGWIYCDQARRRKTAKRWRSCDAEVTGGGALDFPDERAYDICVCPALPPWCFFGLAFGASFQMRLINLCSNLCIYERIYTAATTFGDCSQVGSGNVCCQNTSNSHGIASCRLLAQEDKEVGIWSTACNGIMISNGVVPFSCKLLSSRMCWKKCLQKTLIKGN